MSIPSSNSAVFDHGSWMSAALDLARKGTALAHPNPYVGAIVVRDGEKVGEGFHDYEKRDHAEIVALRAAGEKARGATLYVTLEPCCTAGRTGPCTNAVIEAGIKTVYAAMEDPNPAVAGRGFAVLKKAGIEAHCGIYEKQARELNEDFAKWIRTRIPFVTLKSALTLDGQIAARRGRSTRITSDASLAAVQKMRHKADAILTGIGTVLADDPQLTDRTGLPRRRKLLRVVVDSKLQLPRKSELVKSADGDALVFTIESPDSARARALAKKGVEIVRTRNRRGHVCLDTVLAELGRREMLNVLLEAGAELNGSALQGDLVDKVALFYAPKIMGVGGVPVATLPAAASSKSQPLKNISLGSSGPDFLVEGYFHDVYGDHRASRKN